MADQRLDEIDTYLRHSRRSVPGWFGAVDGWLMTLISDLQHADGVRGDILEIGVFQGKSAILLGHLLRRDETLVVCDPFDGPTDDPQNDEENRRSYRGLQEATFRANYARFHDIPPEVHAVTSYEFGTTAADRRFRAIHIDGSHTHDAVLHDVQLSRTLTGAGGFVVFDDVCNAGVPGVAAAVWGAVATSDLVPIAMTTKLYAVWGGRSAGWTDHLEEAIAASEFLQADPIPMAGGPMSMVRGLAGIESPVHSLARAVVPPSAAQAAARVRSRLRRPRG